MERLLGRITELKGDLKELEDLIKSGKLKADNIPADFMSLGNELDKEINYYIERKELN